ncbi:flavodoxin family protein [Limosilactobacillus reuteri]|uniref:flavodoxin family protein n=1 Tax=Limosilactobacillus reuteri TaxID=1598 RepID=UPI003D97E11B
MAKQALILYYSQFGNTSRLASKIHEVTGADIVRIKVPDDTFPLDMEETGRIYQQQLKTHAFPKLVTTLPDLSYYDLILVGGPVWNGGVASPIIDLLQQIQRFTGKIAPFSTGWSDTGNYQEDFINYAGKLNVAPGYHILIHGSPDFNEKSLFSWLRKL